MAFIPFFFPSLHDGKRQAAEADARQHLTVTAGNPRNW